MTRQGATMQTLYWSVAMPRDMAEAEQELERRLAGTGLDWEHEFQNYYRIRVSSEVLGEEELLESSARQLYELFHDICNPELDELPYPRSAHELIKYYDKNRRRPPGSPDGYLQERGDGTAEVMFTLIVHSTSTDPVQAAAECERQAAAIVCGQEMTVALDIPVRLGTLKKSKTPAYFANYRLTVRVPEQENSFRVVAVAAEILWPRVKERPVHVELDDMNGTLLEAIIKYHIPKSRG